MPRKKTPVYVVSHSHWDREWYFTFEQFRFKLVRMIDTLLDILTEVPRFKYFILDGQTSVLEDYLEIRPEREDDLRKFIKKGRIVIGPWYVMPDEFLVSGESIVRNLLEGRRIASRFGKISEAGYLPDPFGHLAQLPQIFQGFGIDNFLFMRGMVPAERIGAEFKWQALDKKTEILAAWMPSGYANAGMLGYEFNWGDPEGIEPQIKTAMENIRFSLSKIDSYSNCNALLFMNGADHLNPQKELPKILNRANREFDEYDFRHATLEQFVQEVRKQKNKYKTVRGELRSSRYNDILAGVLSARMYLKQANRQGEWLLERWAEPTSSLSLHLGGPDQRAHLWQAWKTLLQNHPHDSICGCSIDSVHRENEIRFEKAAQLAETVVEDNLKYLGSKIDTSHPEAKKAVVLWNTLPAGRKQGGRATLTLTLDDPKDFHLVDAEGNDVGFQIISDQEVEVAPFLRAAVKLRKLDLQLDTPLGGLGWKTLWLLPKTEKPKSTDTWSKKATAKKIETDFYKITFRPNGTFDLYDKASRSTYRSMLLFEDTEDIGDEYDYSPAPKGKTLTTDKEKAVIKIVNRGSLFVDYEIRISWKLPVGIDSEWKSRNKTLKAFPLLTRMRVFQHLPRIEFETHVDNQVKDHRLRVHFTGPKSARQSISDGHFGLVPHPIDIKTSKKHRHAEPTTFHQRTYSALSDGKKGIAFLSAELTEYEALKAAKGEKRLALTLFRSVGYLSHDRLKIRSYPVGPMVPTPEAQCLRSMNFQYAFTTYTGKDPSVEVTPQAEDYITPLRMEPAGIHEGELEPEESIVQVDSEETVWSAWKPSEKGDGTVLRIYNPSEKKRKIQIQTSQELGISGECDLKEEPIRKPARKPAGRKTLELKGYEIKSFILK